MVGEESNPEEATERRGPFSVLEFESSNMTISEMLAEALHAVRLHLDMDVAFIGEFREGQRIFRYVDGRASPLPIAENTGSPLDETYCQRVVDGRLPELIPDTGQLPASAFPQTPGVVVGAHLGVPIHFSDGSLFGTFCCFSSQPDNTLNVRDLHTLRLFAGFAGKLLQRQTSRARVQRSKLARIEETLRSRAYHVVYQPIVQVEVGTALGYEALARFSGEPLRSPDRWFLEAGEVGLQRELEIALIVEALKGLEQLPGDSYISLNVSPETIIGGQLRPVLEEQPLARLMLEITEHACICDYERVEDELRPLRERGLRLAVDDAGAGYASFRHILRLRPDVIKLDGSLINNLDGDSNCRALAAALIRFAAETGSKVVAEGVETEEELAVLRTLGVKKAQGYLLGRPAPLGAVS
ncbi:sensor domain-containing phosphodiesterase [Stutzerimonas balearica]|uniref:sensor domain-containing phosphodiesterase n=1 Tax=Stutzerimonas balearica TaxID=74829 RepID=UPI003F75FAB3